MDVKTESGETVGRWKAENLLNDRSGSMIIRFSLSPNDQGGILLRAWSNYFILSVDRPNNEITLCAYAYRLFLGCPFQDGIRYSVEVNWDSESGLAIRLFHEREMLATSVMNAKWKPYGIVCTFLEIGGNPENATNQTLFPRPVFHGTIWEFIRFSFPLFPPGIPRISEGDGTTQVYLGSVDGITLLELNDPPITESRFRYDIIPDRMDNYHEFNRLHPEFAEAYHGAVNTFEGLRTIGKMVSELWPHTDYVPNRPREIFFERGDRLLSNIKSGKTVGMCGGYAHVMEEVCWALGIPARRTQVRAHSSFEVYDHYHGKWICMETDPAQETGLWLNKEGIPMSIGECIAVNEKDKEEPGFFNNNVLFHSNGAQVHDLGQYGGRMEIWFRYAYQFMFYFLRDDYHDTKAENSPTLGYVTPPFQAIENDLGWGSGNKSWLKDWQELYWSCDHVTINPQWEKKGSVIRLDPVSFQCQFFSGFELKVDRERWQIPRTGPFFWHLHDGTNRFQIRTRNQSGTAGRPWQCVIYRSAEKPDGVCLFQKSEEQGQLV